MKKPSEERPQEEMLQRIIGLGERSLKKSYYPELRKRIVELEQTNRELQREIQERCKAEEQKGKLEFQLRQAQKMEAIGTLAGGIAHDFNNILSAIVGYSELAIIDISQAGPENNHQALAHLDGVLRSADRAKQLVHQILSFSRQREGDKVPVNLEELLSDTVKMLRALIPTTIAIDTSVRTRNTMIMADATQIHQIIMNLGTNAYHAMRDSGGQLHFELLETTFSANDLIVTNLQLTAGQYLELRVSDTGCGMDRQTQSKIFDPYFSTKGTEGGTGLGLSVAHGIITFHQGHISVYSEPGKGTTFRICFPQIIPHQEKRLATSAEAPFNSGHERLLIVDDEEPLREVLQHILENLGYTVTVAQTPQDALVLLADNPDDFDMLITDMNMPVMNGAELITKIREFLPDLPVILCTGFSETMNRKTTKALGHARYLMKPTTQKKIHEAIRSLMD
ncbi:MAG: response regulator [Desulfopila sp.]